jgi:succinylarginine dihydrolase
LSGAEINLDGLVGPTHTYAGLSFGNLASAANRDQTANPREAALQGISKMRRLAALGLPQGVLPPQERPDIAWLRSLGFQGDDGAVWLAALAEEPGLARHALAASAMWTANAATVSPSADCADGRLHLSVANLAAMLHRALEPEQTGRALRAVFADPSHFKVHPALTCHPALGDEGGANHMRLAPGPDRPGLEMFVYGRAAGDAVEGFPARQTLEASRAIARRHRLDPARTVFVRQSRAAIAAGAFHNDVVAVAHEHVLFYHEAAFEGTAWREAVRRQADGLVEPVFVEVPAAAVSLGEAVRSYLFNAQLVRPPGDNAMTLIVPEEARETPAVWRYLEDVVGSGGPIGAVVALDLRQSMRNGGGPACLRLRVQANAAERAAMAQGFLVTDALADRLETWVRRRYRDRLAPADLADPALPAEIQEALDELTAILPLGPRFYPFQRP